MVGIIHNGAGIFGAEVIKNAYMTLAERGERFQFNSPLETIAYIAGEPFAPNCRERHMVYKEGVILESGKKKAAIIYGEKKNEAGHMFQNDIAAVALPSYLNTIELFELSEMMAIGGNYFGNSVAHSRCLGEIVIGGEPDKASDIGRSMRFLEANDYSGYMRMFFIQELGRYVLSQNNMSARYSRGTSELLVMAILKTLEKIESREEDLCPA